MPFSTIKFLVKREYRIADIFDGVYKVREFLNKNEAIVVEQEGKFSGLLTASDILKRPFRVVVDCITEKSSLNVNTGIYEALDKFQESGAEALPVFQMEELYGVLYRNDLMAHLVRESQQLMFSNKNLVMENQGLHGAREKMENLVYSVSHDLKSPLNNIRSLNEMILEKADTLSEETLELLKYTELACNKATEIIGELLKFKQAPTNADNQPQVVEVNRLISGFIPVYETNAEQKELELKSELFAENLQLRIKPVDFTRIMDNLVSNAIKFTEAKGSITISTHKENGKIAIKVSDTGIGIPPEIQKDMFKKFSIAGRLGTRGEQSTGLGLSIVKQIVEKYNGEISLDSKKAKGTCFTITFAEAEPETEASE